MKTLPAFALTAAREQARRCQPSRRSPLRDLCTRVNSLCDHIEAAWWADWASLWGAVSEAIAREAAQWNAAWVTVWTCIGHAMYLEGRHAQDVNRLMDEKWSVEP